METTIAFEELKREVEVSFIMAIIMAYFDITGLFCLASLNRCSKAREDCEEAGASTLLPTLGIVVSFIGLFKIAIAVLAISVMWLFGL